MKFSEIIARVGPGVFTHSGPIADDDRPLSARKATAAARSADQHDTSIESWLISIFSDSLPKKWRVGNAIEGVE